MNSKILMNFQRDIKLIFNLFIILIIGFSISILNSKVALAHKNGADKDGKITETPVHQYIAWEAGNAWKQIPDEMRQYLFLDEDRDNIIYQLLSPMCYAPGGSIVYNIITGSGDEDQVRNPIRTINYSVGCADIKEEENCTGFGLNGFVEHFWDPDKPKSDGFNCGQMGGWYNEGLRDIALSQPNNEEHWDSNYRLAQFYWDHLVLPLYKNGDKAMAYYYLGRIVHLLTDLTVPAHVHNDAHAFGYGYDSLEEFIADWGEVQKYKGKNFTAAFYRYEELDIEISKAKSDFKWSDIHDQKNPPNLFKLFWYVAQKTQYFASDNANGDIGNFVRWNGAEDTFGMPGLWKEDELLVGDYNIPPLYNSNNYGIIDNSKIVGFWESDSELARLYLTPMSYALVPHAIKAVAGLYRLFWIETHRNIAPILSLLLSDINIAGAWSVNFVPTNIINGQCYSEAPQQESSNVIITVSGNSSTTEWSSGFIHTGLLYGNVFRDSWDFDRIYESCDMTGHWEYELIFSDTSFKGSGKTQETMMNGCFCENGTTTQINYSISGFRSP